MADSPAVMQSSSETFVIFRLGNVEYGLPSSCVEQVVAVPERLTAIPKAPGFIEGVINHRGTVLPVIDQRRRFAMTGTARSRHIIVAALGAARAGLMVDAVTGVLKIPDRGGRAGSRPFRGADGADLPRGEPWRAYDPAAGPGPSARPAGSGPDRGSG